MKKQQKCYIYTRVSTSMQVEGYSLDAQKDKLKKYADYQEMVIAGEYSDEGKSGKSVEGRPEFQQMLCDIESGKDNVDFVLVFKLSRFGRNAADVLSSLQRMQDFGVNLICVEDGIDSSKDAGKLMISVLSAVAEIERENILVQTMEGRRQKAREGKWNGGFAPYGYKLVDGELQIAEDEAPIIRLIYDKFVNTTMGMGAIAIFLNQNGYRKKIRQNNTMETFSSSFIKGVLDNPIYCGKLAFGRRKNEKIAGTRNEYHVVKQDSYLISEGIHDEIISEEDWNLAQKKRQETGVGNEKVHSLEHEHILSGIVKCPICGSGMYGNVNRKKRKDGTLYKDYSLEELELILEFLDYHTMAVELVARLLSYTVITPAKLFEELKENILLPSDDIKIPLTKDNQTEKNRYQQHMEKLLDMQELEHNQQRVLAVIALAPEVGIPVKLLYQWYGTCVNELNELLEFGFLTMEHNHIQLHPYIRKIINARKSLSLNDCPQLFEHLRATCVNEISCYHIFALDMVDTTLRFVEKDNEDIWKRIVFAALERNSQYQRFRSFEKLLNECNDICQHYHNISTENSAMLLHFQAVKAAKIYQNYVQALELEEKAIHLATKYGTSQILSLSSMYLDAGRYLALLGKQEKALDYTKKSAGILSNTQMQYSTAGIFILTSYAKLLYESGKINDAIQIYSNCIGLVNTVYGENSITKGYLTQNLAAICASSGNNKMAMLYYSQAESILKQYLEEDNPDLLSCQSQQRDLNNRLITTDEISLLPVPEPLSADMQIA